MYVSSETGQVVQDEGVSLKTSSFTPFIGSINGHQTQRGVLYFVSLNAD